MLRALFLNISLHLWFIGICCKNWSACTSSTKEDSPESMIVEALPNFL